MTVYPKKNLKIKGLIALALFSLLGCTQQRGNTVVARVNQEEILAFDLQNRLREYQFDPTLNSAEKNVALKKKVLNEIIQEHIVAQLALAENLTADPEEVQNILRMTLNTEPAQTSRKKDQVNHMQARIERQLQASLLYAWVCKNVPKPKEEELRAYYDARPEEFVQEEQIRIQQIIVKSQKAAEKVIGELAEDKPFEMLAKKYSAVPQSTLLGDTGYVGRGMFDKVLEDAIYKLQVDQIGPVLETKSGYHVVKVLGKKKSKTLTFAEVRDFIYENLLQQKKEAHYNNWLEQKILQANIERNHAVLQENIPLS